MAGRVEHAGQGCGVDHTLRGCILGLFLTLNGMGPFLRLHSKWVGLDDSGVTSSSDTHILITAQLLSLYFCYYTLVSILVLERRKERMEGGMEEGGNLF